MSSTIYLTATIRNAERRFGSADAYVPVTAITGAHVNAFLRAMHAAKMEALLAPQAPNPPAE